MNGIPDKSIDMILADLPYGTTACSWDSIIPLDKLWLQYERIIKDNGVIVLTASQPFTTKLINSNLELFSYVWEWEKNGVTNFANAKKQPMRKYEEVIVFYKNKPTYNPQGLIKVDKNVTKGKSVGGETVRTDIKKSSGKGKLRTKGYEYKQEFTNYPTQKLKFKSDKGFHPTQKPVALFEYLIKTYTNENDIILDNVAGSGTTGVAAKNTGRNFILMEQEEEYVEIIKERLASLDE